MKTNSWQTKLNAKSEADLVALNQEFGRYYQAAIDTPVPRRAGLCADVTEASAALATLAVSKSRSQKGKCRHHCGA